MRGGLKRAFACRNQQCASWRSLDNGKSEPTWKNLEVGVPLRVLPLWQAFWNFQHFSLISSKILENRFNFLTDLLNKFTFVHKFNQKLF